MDISSLFKKSRIPSKPTHVRQINGYHREAFLDDTRPYPEKIRFTLNQMDGMSFWGFALWRAPKDTDFTQEIKESEVFMHCIGSSKGMLIEVQHPDPDDKTLAYRMLVGKPGDYDGEPSETFQWDNNHRSLQVYSSELFSADEAASILYGYFTSTSVAKYYKFRAIGVTEGVGTKPESYEVSNTQIQKQLLNQAIISYLGKGVSSFPRHDEAAVRELVAKEEANELLEKVKEVISGCMSVEIDWSAHSLSEAGNEAARVMAQRYPDLSEAALDALRWQFTYSNK